MDRVEQALARLLTCSSRELHELAKRYFQSTVTYVNVDQLIWYAGLALGLLRGWPGEEEVVLCGFVRDAVPF